MTGPVSSEQDVPLDLDACKHQMQLLKSLHCGRPVINEGRHKFIQCLSVNRSGSDVQMTVYLAGGGTVDSTKVQIKTSSTPHGETHEA